MNPQNAMEWNKKAYEYEKQGNVNETLKCIEEALKIQPRSEVYLLHKATVLEKAERFEEAYITYHKVMNIIPQSTNGHIGVARILKKLGRDEEAKEYQDEINLRLNPETSPFTLIIHPKKGPLDAYMNKINTLMSMGRTTDATKFCLDYKSKFGDNHWIETSLANIMLGERSWAVALECCDKALKLKPNFYGALLVKANILLQKGESKKALKCIDRLLKQKDVPVIERAEAYSTKGATLLRLHQFNKALTNLDQALKLNHNIGAAWFMKGNVSLNLGRLAAGMEALTKAQEVDKSLAPVIDQMLREMNLK